jgi:hypothetical protein
MRSRGVTEVWVSMKNSLATRTRYHAELRLEWANRRLGTLAMTHPFKWRPDRIHNCAVLGVFTMIVLWLGFGLPWWAALAVPGLPLVIVLVNSSRGAGDAKILELLAEQGDRSGQQLVDASNGALTRYSGIPGRGSVRDVR